MNISDDTREEIENIRINLRRLNTMMGNMWRKEQQLILATYPAFRANMSDEESGADEDDEYFPEVIDEEVLERWRQKQIDNGKITSIENLTMRITTDIMSFVEGNRNFNNIEFSGILHYLMRKNRSARDRITVSVRTSSRGIGRYIWPLPLEHNINNFLVYITDLLDGHNDDAGGKHKKRKYKKSRKNEKHKRQKSRKRRC